MDNEPGEDAGVVRELAKLIKHSKLGGLITRAEYCIHCGFCNSVCPTSSLPSAFKEIRTSRGRAVLFQGLVSNPVDVKGVDEYWVHRELRYCFNCGKCVVVCPVKVPIPVLTSVYRHYFNKNRRGLVDSLVDRLLVDYERVLGIATRLPGVFNLVLSNRAIRTLLSKVGLSEVAPLPRVETRAGLKPRPGGDLLVYVDAYNWAHQPEVVNAILSLVERLGYKPNLFGPKDHYMAAFDLGYIERALYEGGRLLRELIEFNSKLILVISPASLYMLKSLLPVMLGEPAVRVSEKVVDIYTLLLNSHRKLRVGGSVNKVNGVVYHESCLSFSNRQGDRIVKALGLFGIKVVEKLDVCCGMGGAWGLKRYNQDLYLEMSKEFLREVLSRGIKEDDRLIVSESETCRLQVRHVVRGVEVKHPAELIIDVIG